MSKQTDELDRESVPALLLEEAYQLGEHGIKDGCLIPVLERLNAWSTKQCKAARIDELEQLESRVPSHSSGNTARTYVALIEQRLTVLRAKDSEGVA